MPRPQPRPGAIRKLIAFDAATWQALDHFSREKQRPLQELAEEAFADLLRKHHRPVTLADALTASARRQPANDPAPAARKRRRR